MQNIIRSQRGKIQNFDETAIQDSFLHEIEEQLQQMMRNQMKSALQRCLQSQVSCYDTLHVGIISCGLQSRYTQNIIQAVQQHSLSNNCQLHTLRTTSKNQKKSSILKSLKRSFLGQFSTRILFIESFQQWNGEIISDILQFLLEKPQLNVKVVIDLSGDLSSLHLNLRLEVVSKLIMKLVKVPQFGKYTSQLLYNFAVSDFCPIMSQSLFQVLLQCNTLSQYKSTLRMSFLELFKKSRILHIYKNQQELLKEPDRELVQEFVGMKKEWILAFKRLELLFSTPDIILVDPYDLFVQVFQAPEIQKTPSVKLLLKKLSNKKTSLVKWREFIQNSKIFKNQNIEEIFQQVQKMPLAQKMQQQFTEEQAKIQKWASSHIYPQIRKRIFCSLNNFQSKVAKKFGLDCFLLDVPYSLDPDVMGDIIKSLEYFRIHLKQPDMCRIFQIVKNKGFDIDLNWAFTEFVESDSSEDLVSLQNRFLLGLHQLNRMGLVLPSKKRRKANVYYLQKNFFGGATLFNS